MMSLRSLACQTRRIITSSHFPYSCSFIRRPCVRGLQIQRPGGLSVPRKAPVPLPLPQHVSTKYKVFDDKDAVIIKNTSEELLADQIEEEYFDEFEGLNLQRGVSGVFDIEELVNILRHENARDIFVSVVPSHIQYADYICIITGRSLKHNIAIAEFIKKLYKKKRHESDPIPKIEGEDSKEWIALDLGNVALHIFQNDVRKTYDLELLWSVGSEYDDQSKKHSEHIHLMEKHSQYLEGLFPEEEK